MIVLDASALVDVVIDEPAGLWVLEQMGPDGVAAPSHQVAEVLSAVARLGRAEVLDRVAVDRAVGRAMVLDQNLVLPTAAHVRRALALSDRVRVTDGLYVALAEELGCPIVTTGRRLTRAGLDCEIRAPAPS